MDPGEERRALRFLERIADSLERIEVKMCGERPKPAPPADLKDVATAVRMRGGPRETVTNDGFTQGGVPPEEFFARREP